VSECVLGATTIKEGRLEQVQPVEVKQAATANEQRVENCRFNTLRVIGTVSPGCRKDVGKLLNSSVILDELVPEFAQLGFIAHGSHS
jgi:hypothetical protein